MTPRGAAEQEVWEREVASWEHLRAGDVKSFLSLFHDDVTAWPDGRPTPVDKNAIFQHLVAILPMLQAQALTVELTLLAIRVFDNVAIVQYEAHRRYGTGDTGRSRAGARSATRLGDTRAPGCGRGRAGSSSRA